MVPPLFPPTATRILLPLFQNPIPKTRTRGMPTQPRRSGRIVPAHNVSAHNVPAQNAPARNVRRFANRRHTATLHAAVAVTTSSGTVSIRQEFARFENRVMPLIRNTREELTNLVHNATPIDHHLASDRLGNFVGPMLRQLADEFAAFAPLIVQNTTPTDVVTRMATVINPMLNDLSHQYRLLTSHYEDMSARDATVNLRPDVPGARGTRARPRRRRLNAGGPTVNSAVDRSEEQANPPSGDATPLTVPRVDDNTPTLSSQLTEVYMQDNTVVSNDVVPYVPMMVDLYSNVRNKWTANEFINTLRTQSEPRILFDDLYQSVLRDLRQVTREMNTTSIGSKNQVHYISQRIWAKIAHICIKQEFMGAISIGSDVSEGDNSNLLDPVMWHVFQQKERVTSDVMQRVQYIAHMNSYGLNRDLLNIRIGMHIDNTYNIDGQRSILMTTGTIDCRLYVRSNRHKCPFCRTELDLDILQFENSEFESGRCCMGASGVCSDSEVMVAPISCPTCTEVDENTKRAKNPQNICRLCMCSFILAKRL